MVFLNIIARCSAERISSFFMSARMALSAATVSRGIDNCTVLPRDGNLEVFARRVEVRGHKISGLLLLFSFHALGVGRTVRRR